MLIAFSIQDVTSNYVFIINALLVLYLDFIAVLKIQFAHFLNVDTFH